MLAVTEHVNLLVVILPASIAALASILAAVIVAKAQRQSKETHNLVKEVSSEVNQRQASEPTLASNVKYLRKESDEHAKTIKELSRQTHRLRHDIDKLLWLIARK